MSKIDLKKELGNVYRAKKSKPVIIEIPRMNFLMIEVEGNPNTAQSYQEAVEALYALSYALKFMIKKGELGVDYGVMPLEGLWWTDRMKDFSADNKDIWKWTAMIMQPQWITPALVEEAGNITAKKKALPALERLRLESFDEGRVAQVLHVGPYSHEAPTIAALHQFIADQDYRLTGKHHEIYLSDPRRCDPARLRTIIRQPVA